MQKTKFTGMGTALITPFRDDDSVDYEALKQLVEQQISAQADFLVALGTTAETPSLTEEEQDHIIATIVEVNAGRLPLAVGVGGNGTHKVIRRIHRMQHEGVDALLCVCPYYNKPTQEGLYQHFAAIAANSPLPILLYNVPARTAVNMHPDTTLRLMRDCPNIIGIKEASGIVSQIDLIIKQRNPDFIVLSGDDTITYPLLALGADGVISVIGNAFPKEFAQMVRDVRAGNLAEALPVHHRFKELYSMLFVEGNPVGVKATMRHLGLLNGRLRLPLVSMSVDNDQKLASLLASL